MFRRLNLDGISKGELVTNSPLNAWVEVRSKWRFFEFLRRFQDAELEIDVKRRLKLGTPRI